jgi:hypothetical protein
MEDYDEPTYMAQKLELIQGERDALYVRGRGPETA